MEGLTQENGNNIATETLEQREEILFRNLIPQLKK